MFRQLGICCALLALFSLAGGHWAAWQTIAQVKMLYIYAERTGSLATAAAETFDGQHPCELCRRIAVEKSRERQNDPGLPAAQHDAKVKAVLPEIPLSSPVRSVTQILPFQDVPRLGSLPAAQPPTPPPRRGVLPG